MQGEIIQGSGLEPHGARQGKKRGATDCTFGGAGAPRHRAGEETASVRVRDLGGDAGGTGESSAHRKNETRRRLQPQGRVGQAPAPHSRDSCRASGRQAEGSGFGAPRQRWAQRRRRSSAVLTSTPPAASRATRRQRQAGGCRSAGIAVISAMSMSLSQYSLRQQGWWPRGWRQVARVNGRLLSQSGRGRDLSLARCLPPAAVSVRSTQSSSASALAGLICRLRQALAPRSLAAIRCRTVMWELHRPHGLPAA